MTTQTHARTGIDDSADFRQRIEQVRELYADAPEVGRVALENLLPAYTLELAAAPGAQSAGRVGMRHGNVSELTLIAPFAEGGAKRLRGLLRLVKNNFQSTDRVGTVHDMRFVFLDNDSKLLFTTAYDGEWDPYIDDFATKIPDNLDLLFCNCEGWPGIRSASVKDWIAQHQVTAEGWYVGNPSLTVVEARRLERVGKALDEFLDRISN